MPCGTPLPAGFFISTVTLPSLAVSFIVLNAKAPLGSADNLTTEAPPPAVGAAAEVVVALELELELELEPPQALSASMEALASATVMRRGPQKRMGAGRL